MRVVGGCGEGVYVKKKKKKGRGRGGGEEVGDDEGSSKWGSEGRRGGECGKGKR